MNPGESLLTAGAEDRRRSREERIANRRSGCSLAKLLMSLNPREISAATVAFFSPGVSGGDSAGTAVVVRRKISAVTTGLRLLAGEKMLAMGVDKGARPQLQGRRPHPGAIVSGYSEPAAWKTSVFICARGGT